MPGAKADSIRALHTPPRARKQSLGKTVRPRGHAHRVLFEYDGIALRSRFTSEFSERDEHLQSLQPVSRAEVYTGGLPGQLRHSLGRVIDMTPRVSTFGL